MHGAALQQLTESANRPPPIAIGLKKCPFHPFLVLRHHGATGVDISFKDFDTRYATPLTTGVDFETLCAALSAAQAVLPTVKLTQPDGVRRRGFHRPAEEAVVLLRREDGWEDATTAMRGSFHADAAARLPVIPL